MIDNSYFTYDGNRGTNIESAIKLASESFETSSHRRNVQKVIVIVASAYESGNYDDPTKIAKSFIQDGGFIATVEYLQEHGNPVPLLNTLSSGPEYSFTNRFRNLTAEQIRQAFCRMFPSKTKFWIGLKYLAATGLYQWSDGTYLWSSDFQMWAPGYPNANAGYCVYMYQYTGFSYGWFNDECSDDQNYICQTVPCSADNYCATRD
ncbi:unnamed protein product [Cylicocyclus nassatus]|uniref:C-type lectin domain-containing protein n=1 Tax=Cylicocyclus nassatus TaxID=53992 RepID=A0AA36M3C8_CYLNA|nr:unnamed protein product [Cylicocyclus nassatus]